MDKIRWRGRRSAARRKTRSLWSPVFSSMSLLRNGLVLSSRPAWRCRGFLGAARQKPLGTPAAADGFDGCS
ncbi:hypothetical protein VTN02DRAFT_960 [Thermoascus thermophilus]